MSTYAAWFKSPLVHAESGQPAAAQPTDPAQQPQFQQSNVFGSPETRAPRVMFDGEREPVSTTVQMRKRRDLKWEYEQLQSPFFQLPAELRNEIYEYLLCPEGVCEKELREKTKDLSVRGFNQSSSSTTIHPDILSTCRKAHSEATSLLYSRNIFHAHPSLLAALPHLTSPARPVLYHSLTTQIRRWQITLRLDTDPRFTYRDAKVAFSGAEYLEIRVWQSQFEAADWSTLKLFTGVRAVGIAKVGGSVSAALARWLEHVMMLPDEPNETLCQCEKTANLRCGQCHRRVEQGLWIGSDWNVWKFGGR